MQRISRITKGLIRHPRFVDTERHFIPLCRDADDGLVIVLLAPTQSGKSIILKNVVSVLIESFHDPRPGAIPIVSLQVETVNDGRAKPKWLAIELLKAVKHPVYQHIGCLDEKDHYVPSRGLDEGRIRIAVKEAFHARFVRRSCLDEAHLLTRTKDSILRASILESIKSLCAIDRTLILAGGYELAYNGLFDSPHFCGRVITYDMGNYEESSKEDVEAWVRILKTYSKHLDLEPKSLLVDRFSYLLTVTNGVFGLLDKLLWKAKMTAFAKGTKIDGRILLASGPSQKEWKAVSTDIAKGRSYLASMGCAGASQASTASKQPVSNQSSSAVTTKKKSQHPFERAPNRNPNTAVEIGEDL